MPTVQQEAEKREEPTRGDGIEIIVLCFDNKELGQLKVQVDEDTIVFTREDSVTITKQEAMEIQRFLGNACGDVWRGRQYPHNRIRDQLAEAIQGGASLANVPQPMTEGGL